eukprot:m.65888 g.65888  ORF g.65888 m.65888 type:complete len:1129 (-) comp13697_c0_seq2:209-3595(-)
MVAFTRPATSTQPSSIFLCSRCRAARNGCTSFLISRRSTYSHWGEGRSSMWAVPRAVVAALCIIAVFTTCVGGGRQATSPTQATKPRGRAAEPPTDLVKPSAQLEALSAVSRAAAGVAGVARADAPREEDLREPPGVVLVATLDGHMHGIDVATGETKWTLDSGPMLLGPPQTRHHHGNKGGEGGGGQSGDSSKANVPSSRPVFLPDPVDGSLFLLTAPDDGSTTAGTDADTDTDNDNDQLLPVLRRVPKTVQELVTSGYTDDGQHVYLGELRTSVFGLDPSNGSVLRQYELKDSDRSQLNDDVPLDSNNLLTIGRKEYTIVMRDRLTEKVFWNMTMAEFVAPGGHADDLYNGDDPAINDDESSKLLFVSHDPTRHSLVVSAPQIPEGRWAHDFASPVLAVYAVNARGHLVKHALHVEPFRGASGGPLLDFERNPRKYPQTPHALSTVAGSGRHAASVQRAEVVRIDHTSRGLLFASTSLVPDNLVSESGDVVVGPPVSDSSDRSPGAPVTALSTYNACGQHWSPACLRGLSIVVAEDDTSSHRRNTDGRLPAAGTRPRSPFEHFGSGSGGSGGGDGGDVRLLPEDNPLLAQSMRPGMDPVPSAYVKALPIVVAMLCVVVVYLVILLQRLHRRQKHLEQHAAQQADAALLRPLPALVSSSDEEGDEDDESGTHADDEYATASSSNGSAYRAGGLRGKQRRRKDGTSATAGASDRDDVDGDDGRSIDSHLLSMGKLVVDRSTTLGHGSHGTVVHNGTFEGVNVAVKRVLKEFYDIAHHEVNLLRKSDDHPNVVRYYCMEEDGQFLYIGLELCVATLVQVVEGPSVSTRGTHHGKHLTVDMAKGLDRRELARDFMAGLAHLHSLNIVHRDVKPHNVLLSPKMRAMISDFGLCAALRDNQSSFQTSQAGTTGWVAPEMLRDQRMTRAVDIFSAGCVIHYLLHGCHPFGAFYEREMNIRRGKRKITRADPLIDNLLLRMLAEEADTRPTAAEVLAHPYFWSPAKQLAFLMDLSDRIEKEPAGSNLLVQLEKHAVHVVGVDWRQQLDKGLLADLERFRKYNCASVTDLLRALRNKRHHYRELPKEVQLSLGHIPEGFLNYFTSRFPRLLLHVYQMVERSVKDEPVFQAYFRAN